MSQDVATFIDPDGGHIATCLLGQGP